MADDVFVQIGATRDGLDPYLDAAHARGLRAFLVETRDYLAYRSSLPGRGRFDREIPVWSLSDSRQVAATLADLGVHPRLVLAGFDRYAAAAHELDAHFEGRPAPHLPFDKASQRSALAQAFPDQPQPAFATTTEPGRLPELVGQFPGPVVVKAIDAAGGLGVYRVATRTEAHAVAARLEQMRNYDGAPFAGLLVEELVAGTEFSLQGIARHGRPDLLSACEKVVGLEADPTAPHLCGFRELAHLARPGHTAPGKFVRLANRCLTAFGYRDGPFQIDLIRGAQDGRLYFLEQGYRLSGAGLVRLIEQLTGQDWGDLSFGWALTRESPAGEPPAPRHPCVGQCLLRGPAELARAAALRRPGVVVEITALPAPRPGAPVPAAEALRHSGFAGRARVVGPSVEAVREVVACILGQEGGRLCAG